MNAVFLRCVVLVSILAVLALVPLMVVGWVVAALLNPTACHRYLGGWMRDTQTLFAEVSGRGSIFVPSMKDLRRKYEADVEGYAQLALRSLVSNMIVGPEHIERRDGFVRVRTRFDPQLAGLTEKVKRRAAELLLTQGNWHQVDMSDELGTVWLIGRES